METPIIIKIVLIAVYLLSFYMARRYHQKAYGKGGIWESVKPNLGDFILTILPLFNTVTFIVFYACGDPIEEKNREGRSWIKKFFNIKERL